MSKKELSPQSMNWQEKIRGAQPCWMMVRPQTQRHLPTLPFSSQNRRYHVHLSGAGTSAISGDSTSGEVDVIPLLQC